MGVKDSSLTRVEPVFTALLERDPTGVSWVQTLVDLPEREGQPVVRTSGRLEKHAWGGKEHLLVPPPALLEYLVEHPPADLASADGMRKRLAGGDAEAREEALRLLRARDRSTAERAWYVLEGDTHVDAYLETDDLIVLVEGKRTERGLTTKTTWMPVRHQMLRNLDCAWEARGAKQVVGFFIVGADANPALPEEWRAAVRATVEPGALDASLPHRSVDERRAIADAFIGATTWGAVCARFGIDYDSLPDTVPAARS